MKDQFKQKDVFTILFCQFISGLCALGMPPFFGLILKGFRVPGQGRVWFEDWAGLIYVLPTLCAAFASPFWGWLSDRYGKKKLLLRAQLGLTLSFVVAGFAKSPEVFVSALMVQGLLGGTFAASRAYLASALPKGELAQSLTLLEMAPRAALVISPLLMGAVLGVRSPVEIYRLLALFPLISVALTLGLKEIGPKEVTLKEMRWKRSAGILESSQCLRVFRVTDSFRAWMQSSLSFQLQFFYGFAAVLVSPYFIVTFHQRLPDLSMAQLGMIFGIPHLVYLAFAPKTGRLFSASNARSRIREVLIAAFLGQALSWIGQAEANSLMGLLFWRGLNGLTMTLAFVGLHEVYARQSTQDRAGTFFGWLESSLKVSTVLGGVAASLVFKKFGGAAPFWFSAALLSGSAGLLGAQFLTSPSLASKAR